MVYVLDINGQPLMPTERFGKVYRLLKNKKAKVVKRCPFTIKLLYEPKTCIVQEVTIGVDTGSKNIGVACVGNNKVLYQSQISLRDNIKSNINDRKMYRRNRRSRKTRYRKARFLNRRNSIKKDRLLPSVRHKVQAHIDEIESCKKILPISKIVLEVSQFDPALIKNPSLIDERIKHWGYQKGFNYGFSSRKEAVLNRDEYTCQICHKKNIRLEVHHIIFRSNGGTDDENNLITLCENCHSKIHKSSLVLTKKPKKMNLKHATHMSIIRSQLLKYYLDAIETFGFVTKENRNNLKLHKDHYIDACVIASGGKEFLPNNEIFYKKRISHGNYQLYDNNRNRMSVSKLDGFRRFDKVLYRGQIYFIKGKIKNKNPRLSSYGCLMDIFGNDIKFSYLPWGQRTPKLCDMKRISARNTVLIYRQTI